MNATKRININFSSLVGLKAELLKKQMEVSEAKLKAEFISRAIPKPRNKIKRPRNEDRKDDKTELSEIDAGAHKKSKLMLEAKAKLYDRLKKSKNNHDNFLVDFTNKSDESEEEKPKEESDDDMMYDEDGWVEYVDCFGRTRKCLREDLPAMQEKDKMVEEQVMKRKNEPVQDREIKEPPPEKEPEIEIMRRKWEEQTQKLADKTDIHYQDILFDEARAHGVGYYAFSQDEEERIKQQQNLAKLRMETEKKQKELKELRDLRDKMEQNRLKAARIRQRIRAGLPAEPTEEELAQQSMEAQNSATNEAPQEAEKPDRVSSDSEKQGTQEQEKDTTAKKNSDSEDSAMSKENKVRALGELLSRRTWQKMSQEEWVEKYRNARLDEFGPVYSNFHRGGYLVPENSGDQSTEDKTPAEPLSPYASNERLNTLSSNDHLAENSQDDSSTTTLAKEANETSTVSENREQYSVAKNIDEESIIAGLKYLREKFEERQST